ncbi:MAG: nitroreductase family deazaflavin-dependent oxidoreductase [Propionibacteriaceae bacterium]|nr:nitroreductase family deazaflavin-dependent oxidoreductase [Propionibacteriaceae bacterium]
MPNRSNAAQRIIWLVKNTINRVAIPTARRGIGPFSLIRHVGRKSGRHYETPVLLAELPGYLVLELTYGERVDWFRNISRMDTFEVVHRGKVVTIDRIEPCSVEQGRAAYGPLASRVLRATDRQHFRLLHIATT